ncbi:hypothetical protein VDG1235_2319 [Verrucomicrobiia bacterium DG1235]|nr:hypothetical protein VDG1235_2319 [Verrucomicrobiae bacterium DG1235]
MNRREAVKRTALMLGIALTSSGVTSALSQATDTRQLGAGARFLSKEAFAKVEAIAELILPRSDTPGAKDVGVAEFVDVSFGKYLSEDEKELLRTGLTKIETNFASSSLEEQGEVYRSLVESSSRFLWKLRELVLIGYFTSETVGKTVLRFDPIPGKHEGCLPYEQGTPAWTI